MPFAATVAAAAALATAQLAGAATFVVNTTDDRDDELCNIAHCSLREAINNANDTPGGDIIGFAIGAGGPQSIDLQSELPAINDPVTIDGTTQPSFEGEPIVEIEGDNITAPAAAGLRLNSPVQVTVRGLVINRFSGAGIVVSGSGGSELELNYIGTDMTGTAALGNLTGVSFDNDGSVGGFADDERNVISGNDIGVYVGPDVAGVDILGNFIGTNAAGTAALGNRDGVVIDAAGENDIGNIEGGPNVISGNAEAGIRITNSDGTRVTQNFIGTDLAGERDLGNRQEGVLMVEGVGTRLERNTVRFNGAAGVNVLSGVQNALTRNAISSNAGLGIDLGEGGVTENDDRDPDSGANNLQNFPVLESAETNGTDLITIQGALNTVVEERARLEFFASATCDPSGNGEGARFLGTSEIETFGGEVEFSFGYEMQVAAGEAITATATVGDSTSEFSKCVEAEGPAGASLVVNSDADPGDGECTRANCTLREAITAANATPAADTITFSIPFDCAQAPCVVPIELASSLPNVTAPALIDGETQFPSQTGPGIRINGSDAGPEGIGLFLEGGNSTVRGLVITNFGGGSGIYLGSDGNIVTGNYLGVTERFVSAGNARGITAAGSDNTIGPANVISSNDAGVRLLGDENRVVGNFIGTDPGGTRDLGNVNAGVLVQGSDNRIGGAAAGEGNTIAFNGHSATGVDVASGSGNAIRANSIHSSVGLGIDLGSDGKTANDAGDADAGPNNLQNFPVLTSAERLGSNVVVSGDLDSAPSTRYDVELFLESTCDPSGNGEGPLLLGSTAVTTTPAGDASFAVTLPLLGGGTFVTATATDPSGNTSEFSACTEIQLPSGLEPLASPADCAPAEDGGRTVTFEEPGEGPLAIRYASIGLRFTDDDQTTPILYSNTDERATISPPTSAVNDADTPAGSGGVPLTILFDEPQTAVGFFAGNAESGPLNATIRAYGSDDVLLGTLQITVPVDDVTTFRGVLREGGGILKVTLDYGSSSLGEEIDDLCFLGPELAEGPGDALTLTVDAGSNPAGSATRVVPLSSIPANQLPSFSGSPAAAPVGSIPVGSIPVGSIPVGSIPVGSIPVGSIPVGSIPVGSIPVGSIPVGSIGLESIPVGSIGLDQILLSSLPVDWTPIFAGTPKAGVPVQTLTLADVYAPANAPARQRFESLTFAQSGLAQTLLGGVPLAALLLGEKHLNQLPPPDAPTWCAAIVEAGGDCTGLSPSTNTVVGLAVAGTPVGSIPVGSIPVGSIGGGIAGTPVGSIPLRDLDIAATRLAQIKLVDIPNVNTVVDCAALGGCTGTKTLGDAAAATPTAIRLGVTLSALQAVLGNITLNEIIIGLLPRSALAWEGFPLDGLQLFTANPVSLLYSIDFDIDCAPNVNPTVTFRPPDGYVLKPGGSTLQIGAAAPVPAPNPVTNAKTGARFTLPDPCAGDATQHVKLESVVLSSFELGRGVASATVNFGGTVERATDAAPVLVTQNWESNDEVQTAQPIAPDQLVVGHIARSGDQEVFTTTIPSAPGTVTTFYLSHIGEGADFDLVVGAPATPPLQSSPVGSIPVGSIPVEDHGSDVDNSDSSLPPETLQDIPVGSIPVGSISANRGSVDEVAEVVSRGESGVYTIVVRGYNGSFSREPFMLRVKRTPAVPLPACAPRGLSLGTAGALPPGLSADRRSLFLVNKQRMEALYGVAETALMLQRLGDLAARDEVRGAILQVDGNAAVRSAYANWDANLCDVEAANGVVRAINDVVAGYRGSLPDLRYVVLLGTDDAMPMARVPDRVTVSPERDFETDLRFTTQNLTQGNALYAATARSYTLTDGAYGAFTRIEWLGRELFLPQVVVSRLVETPDDIRGQIDQYLDPLVDGKLDPSTALGTDYDFLDDGGQDVFDALAALVTTATHLENTWTKQDLVNRFTGKTPPDDINAVNAHYSQWQIQPQTAANVNDLVTTANVPQPAPNVEPAFRNRILFTMGCHGNFNVPNTYFPSEGTVPQPGHDWSETWARQQAAVYVANTGYGYGDTVTNALSERLMTLFAQNLGRDETIGEIYLRSLHDYFDGAGAYDVYDEKVLIETSFRGLPFWEIDGATSPPPPTPPGLVQDGDSGLQVARLTITPNAVQQPASLRGSFWSSLGNTQVTHFRPIQPRTERNVTVPGMVAHGVVIKSLQTTDFGGINPVLATPTIDLSENEPERNFRPPYWPASFVNLTRSRQLGAERQSLVVNAGQFRAAVPPGDTGTERIVTSIGVDVLYSTNTTDFVPPAIHQVSAVFNAGTVRIFVRATDANGLRRGTALVNDGGGWRFVELTREGELFTGTVSGLAREPEIATTIQDPAGNTGQSTNKAVNFTPTVDTDGPEILIESPLPEAAFSVGQVVRADYSCSEAAGVQTCAGPVPSGQPIDTSTPGRFSFTVNATSFTGAQSTVTHEYVVRNAQHFLHYQLGQPESVGETVTLVDSLGTLRPRLEEAEWLWNPAEKRRQGKPVEPIQRPDEHFVCYGLPTASSPERLVTVRNQFGESRLRVGRALTLCTPAAKSTSGAPAQPPDRVNHYTCYDVRGETPTFTSETLVVRDQFGQRTVRIDRTREFCNPAEKRRPNRPAEPIARPQEHIVCYRITSQTPAFGARTVFTRDQFGLLTVRVRTLDRLCVPSTKV